MDKQLRQAIEKFNNHEFFECHDILEDKWFEVRQYDKNFYQGLLHFAVAFHHLKEKKNPAGAKLQFKKCIDRLKNYDKKYKGIDLESILKTAQKFLNSIEKKDTDSFKIPLIKMGKI